MECLTEIAETPTSTPLSESEVELPSEGESRKESQVQSSLPKSSSSQVESTSLKMPSSETIPASQIEPSSQALSSSSSKPGPSTELLLPSDTSSKNNGPAQKKQRLDYNSMSSGVYLDSTVVPILHVALVTLDRLRPADPVQFVIDFLLRNKNQYSKPKNQPASGTSANQA